MSEATEQDLVLYYYGEADHPDEIARQLEESPALLARYEELQAMLDSIADMEIPELSPSYGATTWARLRPQLEAPRRSWSWSVPRWAWAGAMSMALITAFLIGRQWPAQGPTTLAAADRERILLVSVAEHLEQSQMLLLEIVNTENGGLDQELGQGRAADLASLNRLYRQTAAHGDRAGMVDVLEELERFLVELSHSPPDSDLGAFRTRLEKRDLLFRVRVLGSNLREAAESPVSPLPGGQST